MKLHFNAKLYLSGNSYVVRVPKQFVNEKVLTTDKKYCFEVNEIKTKGETNASTKA